MMASSLGIVVGIDGSQSAQHALTWALEEARLRQLPLTAVHGWDYNYYPAGVVVEVGSLEGEARELLADAVAPWRDEYPDVTIDIRPIRASSGAAALAEASQDADLVVVGSRGRNQFVGMMLGSVSSAIVQRAYCPVVVIRGERHEPQAP